MANVPTRLKFLQRWWISFKLRWKGKRKLPIWAWQLLHRARRLFWIRKTMWCLLSLSRGSCQRCKMTKWNRVWIKVESCKDVSFIPIQTTRCGTVFQITWQGVLIQSYSLTSLFDVKTLQRSHVDRAHKSMTFVSFEKKSIKFISWNDKFWSLNL